MEKLKAFLPLGVACICWGVMIYTFFPALGSYGGEDSFCHYLFARYSWKHPSLFLDHWGKPLFTLLASPFAQAGWQGMVFFNLICSAATSWIAYRIALIIKLPLPWLVFPILCFNPLFFVCAGSGLTEPLFALCWSCVVLAFLNKRYIMAAVLASTLPFLRSEGNLLILYLIPFFILEKKANKLPWLSVFTLIYMGIGYFAKSGNWAWIWNENPYVGAADIYGKGGFFDLFKNNREMFGVPESILLVVGLLGIGKMIYVNYNNQKDNIYYNNRVYLIWGLTLGSFLVYITAHSWFWYQGLYGSYGLVRVLGAVIPMATLVVWVGISSIWVALKQYPTIAAGIVMIPLAFVVYDPFFQYEFPFPLSTEQTGLKKAAKRFAIPDSITVFVQAASWHVYTESDPYDTFHARTLKEWGHIPAKSGDWVVWDQHFGPQESQIPLERLKQDSSLIFLDSIGEKEYYLLRFQVK